MAADNRLFVPSMVNDSVTAYDAGTGDVLWRFVSDGPVRLAPIVDQGKVYFASDDGHLYCVTPDPLGPQSTTPATSPGPMRSAAITSRCPTRST
ncbi:MAG: PQQ-like beta-propeller repeat protein [Rhodopirellula sp.]|nr:PQQ-like beta-propeller repeat protein [Rhodopirellula sp.]